MGKIRVIYKRVGEAPEVGLMENTYEALKAYFNQGMLEAVPFCGTTMYLDERGKFKNLEPNFAWMYNGTMHDIIVGNVVFTNTADDGNEVDLTDEQIHELNTYFEIVGWYKDGRR